YGAAGIIEQFFPLYLNASLPINGSRSLFTHPNFYAGYLKIHMPVGIYLYFNTTKRFQKNLIAISWLCILIALGFSGSLAGQLIAALQIISALIFFLANQKPDQAKHIVFAVVTGVIVYFCLNRFLLDIDPLLEITQIMVPQNADHLYTVHVDNRLVYWMGAWDIFVKHWLIGSGLLTFTELYPFTGYLETYPHALLPPHAHSLYIQTASEVGLVGFGLLMASIFFAFQKNIKKLKILNGATRELTFFILLSLSGLLIHGISEYNWLISLFIFYFVLQIVSLGVVLRTDPSNENSKSGASKGRVLLSISAFSIFIIGYALLNYYQYNQIIIDRVPEAQTLKEVEQQLSKAKKLCGRCGVPYYLSGFANLNEAKKRRSNKLFNKAQEEFSDALKRNPYNSEVYMYRGDLLSLQKKNQEAKQSYQMAMRDSRYMEIARIKIENLEKLN
nr:O-antigen ligase family protein [Nitrospinota bacterium]